MTWKDTSKACRIIPGKLFLEFGITGTVIACHRLAGRLVLCKAWPVGHVKVLDFWVNVGIGLFGLFRTWPAGLYFMVGLLNVFSGLGYWAYSGICVIRIIDELGF